MVKGLKNKIIYISINILVISVLMLIHLDSEAKFLIISVLILTILASILYIIYDIQSKKISRLTIENKNLVTSRDSSLEYIDALWESENVIVQSEKLTSLNSLVSGIAYELNSPLGVSVTAVTYLNDLIRSQIGALQLEEAKPMLDTTMDNLRKSITLVEKFTEMSGGLETDASVPVKLTEFIDFACCKVDMTIPDAGTHKIIRDLPKDLWINISQQSLSIVIKNLIENALYFAFKGSKHGEILITVKQHARDLTIVIKDNGVGISEEEITKIFDPFFTTKRNNNHHGLGLVIAHNILTSYYNGSINCNSIIDSGTEFSLTIPDAICTNPYK